jgi:hypothetical protein
MSLCYRKALLVDERLLLVVRHARLTTLRAGSSPAGQRDYDLLLRDAERQLMVIDARLKMIEVNAVSPDSIVARGGANRAT